MRAAAAFLVLGVAGCGSFGAAAPDATDGGSDEMVGERRDAGGPNDADAAGAPARCADAHWLCDDFDERDAAWPTPPWDAQSGSATSLARTAAVARSAPSSLEVSLAAGQAAATLSKVHAGSIAGAKCTFALYLDTTGTDRATILQLHLSGGSAADYTTWFTVEGRDLVVFDDTTGENLGPVPLHEWIDVAVVLQFGESLDVLVNGAVRSDFTTGAASQRTGTATSLTFQVGVDRTDASGGAWHVYVDDVVCDAP